MLLNCCVGEDSWESFGLQRDPLSPSQRRSVLGVHWKDWCWSWNSNTLATWCEELTHLNRLWCWERWKAGEGDDRGWYGRMASWVQWTWVWVCFRNWWWTGRPGVLQFMGSPRVRPNWATELNWCNLDSRDILPTKVHLVKAMVFPVVMYECESWTKRRLSTEELMLLTVVLEKTLESPLDLKEI